MMKKTVLTLAALLSMGTAMATFTGCRDTQKSDVEKAADDVGDAVEDAADDVGDALE